MPPANYPQPDTKAAPAPTPSRFAWDEDSQALLIDWSDGTASSIAFQRLRENCPCAICQGEPGMAGRFTSAEDAGLTSTEIQPVTLALVGNYAVNVEWRDGHNTGIYTFSRLRQLGLPG